MNINKLIDSIGKSDMVKSDWTEIKRMTSELSKDNCFKEKYMFENRKIRDEYKLNCLYHAIDEYLRMR